MNVTSIWRLLQTRSVFVLVSVCWLVLIGLVLTIGSVFERVPNELNPSPSEIQYHKLNVRLNAANREIEELMRQNRELSKNLQLLNGLKHKTPDLLANVKPVAIKTPEDSLSSLPTTQTEQSLRRLKQNVDEIWIYLKNKLDSKSMPFISELRYNMLHDMNLLSKRDSEWRTKELASLADFVQSRLKRLQNPNDCQKARKLICDLNKNCGFGCQMHHLAHCLVAATALNRTLVANTNEWRSRGAKQIVWNQLFQPLSQTCQHSGGDNHTHWSTADRDNYQVIHFPIIDFIDPKPDFLPLVIPRQISDRLVRLSGEPFIWFIGQLIKYIMRPSDRLKRYLDHFKQMNQFTHPIVGIHVRRTDKIGTEAKFHSIDEYMSFVDDFYNRLDLRNERNSINNKTLRRVYLATDEPEVWKTEITSYQEKSHVFIGDIKLSESADPSKRSGFESLHNVVVDLLLLSECDYIVCTFSSQICRLAFELMQTRISEDDKSLSAYSLDDIYYFGGQV